jgi:hypothetical protein
MAAKAKAFAAFVYGCGIFGLDLFQALKNRCLQELMGMTTSVFYRGLRSASPALALAAALAAPGSASAQSAVYKCVDAQGRVEFTDTSRRGCKALELPGLIPAPPRRMAPSAPATPAAAPPRQAAPAASPANFPRVESYAQKVRDDERRDILTDELRSEEKRLAEQRREFNNGAPERQGNERNFAKFQERVGHMRDDLSRTERNIEALKREIANIR